MPEPPNISRITIQGACCAPNQVPLPPDEVLDDLSRALKALSHPVRLRIMHILSGAGGSICACDVDARFELSQPTISHHLRLLREAGLVDTEQRGSWVHYSVRKSTIVTVARRVAGLTD